MLRLRTTTALSVLALAVGIAGTGWLSALTAHWPDAPRGLAVQPRPAAVQPLHARRQLDDVLEEQDAVGRTS